MELIFPTTFEQLQHALLGMESISFNGIMTGCIGVIDGWLFPLEVPTSTLVGNVHSYFSGHYQRYGFNIFRLSPITWAVLFSWRLQLQVAKAI